MTTITSITISRTQITAVIQDWLNTNVLRTPQTVTSYEIDDGAVTIALTAAPTEPVVEPPPAPVAAPPAQEQQEDTAAPQPAPKSGRIMPRRKLTDDEHATVRFQAQRGYTVAQIASNLGVARSSVQKLLDEPAQ